jgi:hypothetical protein
VNSADWAEWIVQQRQRLSGQPLHGYHASDLPMAEPVAVSALASTAYRWREPAEAACRALVAAQQSSGAVAVRLDADGPHWTTSLACLAWRRFEISWPERSRPWCTDAYQRGIDFLLSFGGEKIDPSKNIGHNTQLVGWPWVAGTHSWLEPTALALMALRQCGHADHPRAVEAAELIIDRLLPDGGANYGNTFVLGQVLRPHVLPSAMCIVALHGLEPKLPALAPTQTYLRSELATGQLAALSLAWTMHAIVSADWDAADAAAPGLDHFDDPLQAALGRLQVNPANPYRLNMLLLATSLRASPLLDMEPFTMMPTEGKPT